MEIISEEEKTRLLFDFNDTGTDYPQEKTLQQLFEEEVEKVPEGIAVVAPVETHQALTYRELNEMSSRLAWQLRKSGSRPGAIVGIMAEASLEMIIALLAILKIGGAYLPVNPDYPAERKKYLLEDGNIKLLLTNCNNELPGNSGLEILHLENRDIYDDGISGGGPYVESRCGPGSLAYIIYTSGSTGGPKGVMVEHRSVVRLVKNTNYVQFNREDRILQTGALEFDASTFEIWGALLNGLALYLMTRESLLEPAKLKEIIRSRGITTIWMTAPLFNRMLDADIEIFRGLHYLLAGGDVLSPPHINRVRNYYPGLQVINGYGPTENTTFSTTFAVNKDYNRNIPIGSPIANSTAYILDRYGHAQPMGVYGELWTGGDGVSRGYLNDPERTAEKFPPAARGKLYRTGDLVRWLADGNIEFLGRSDQQVKIRGFRIELEEIEHQMLSYERIKEAVVVTKPDEKGDKYICGYIVSQETFNLAELIKFLSSKLPDYMIPAHIVPLENIPLTPNGKVDKRALPEPGTGLQPDMYVPPQDDIEEKLVHIWSEVLAIEETKISTNADFFQVGGHSLRATLMAAKIRKELNVELPLAQVFQSPTIKELSDYIKGLTPSKYISLEPTEKKEYYDLSHAQERVWALSQLEDASIAFNIPMVQVLEGELNIPAFDRTFKALVERHESFRTTFFTIDGKPKQKILPPEDVVFQVNHIHLEGDPGKETKTREQVKQESVIPFDLTEAPLLRVFISRWEEKKHVFFLNMHHIISDFLSFDVFIGELLILYGAFLKEEPNPLEPLRIQYKDYARWHNEQLKEERFNLHREYWLSRLAGKLPRLELPLDKERPAVQTYNGADVVFVFEEVFFEKLKAFSETHHVTLFMTLLTALNLLFYHYTGQTDILLGAIIAGREHADLQGQVGYYLNTLALRSRFDAMDTFTAVLNNVKTVLTEAYQHQAYPFDLLVQDLGGSPDRSRHPIFDVVADMLNYNADHEETLKQSGSGNIRVKDYDFQITTTKFDLTIYFVENKKSMDIRFEYNIDLFEAVTIEQMVDRFRRLLDSILADPNSVVSGLRLEEKARAPKIQRISRRQEGKG
jgi:amino acid adenylation domain-containing protein